MEKSFCLLIIKFWYLHTNGIKLCRNYMIQKERGKKQVCTHTQHTYNSPIISMLTIIANYIKWCPNKPQSKFVLYHLTECVVNEVSAEQLSINNKKSTKYSQLQGTNDGAVLYVFQCNVTSRLECVRVCVHCVEMNEHVVWSIRLHGVPNIHNFDEKHA